MSDAEPNQNDATATATRSRNIWAKGNRLYTAIALGVAVLALYGGSLPNDTSSDWFKNLKRPDILPRELERKIGLIWTALFLLAGVALAKIMAVTQSATWKANILALITLQLFLNYSYSYTFTELKDIPTAFWIALGLAGVTGLIVFVAALSKEWLISACFVPYLAWVGFATYVTYRLAELNPAV